MAGTDLSEEDFARLFYGFANTRKALPWNALRKTAEVAGQTVSIRQRCEMLLRLVNGEALDAGEWDRFMGAPIEPRVPSPTPIPHEVAIPLCAALGRVVENAATAINEIGKNIAAYQNGHIVTLPAFDVVGRKWVSKPDHVAAETPGDALLYALSLFVDPARGLGKRLRRCAWVECGRFRFVGRPIGPGQPPTYYCNEQHQANGIKHYERTRKATARARARKGRKS